MLAKQPILTHDYITDTFMVMGVVVANVARGKMGVCPRA
jgi:hypothetical protein